jgi:hypothetical protein
VKGSGALTPPWSVRARLPGSTHAEETSAEAKAAALVANGAALAAAVFAPLRAAVDDAAGRAIAAVLLDKSPEKVTREEAAAALADPVALIDGRPHDVRAAQTYRAIRAGFLAVVTKLTPEILSPSLTHQFEDVMVALDNGETIGWATPAPGKRSEPGKRAFKAHWLAVEVAFQKEKLKRSRDYALGAVTGVWRGDRPADAPPPILRWRASFEALQKHLKQGEALDPAAIAEAEGEGKKIANGGEPSTDFMRRRNEYIVAWNAKAKRSSPSG